MSFHLCPFLLDDAGLSRTFSEACFDDGLLIFGPLAFHLAYVVALCCFHALARVDTIESGTGSSDFLALAGGCIGSLSSCHVTLSAVGWAAGLLRPTPVRVRRQSSRGGPAPAPAAVRGAAAGEFAAASAAASARAAPAAPAAAPPTRPPTTRTR